MQRGIQARLRYRIREFIAGGVGRQLFFLALLTAGIVALFTGVGLALGIGPDGTGRDLGGRLEETAWYYLGRVVDTSAFVADAGAPERGISALVTVLGVVVTGLLIAVLVGNFQAALGDARKHGAPAIESGHFLVLGWSEKVFPVIDQLAEAYALSGRITVVVMAERPKLEMERQLVDKLRGRRRLRLVVRGGSPTSLDDLSRVSAAQARAIVVLLDEADGGDPDRSDARVLKTLMAIFNHPDLRVSARRPRVTAEIAKAESQDLARIATNGQARVVKTGQMIAKIILQTARISGLSLVYDEILAFEGSEIHFKNVPKVVGRCFGDILLDFPNGMLLGVAKGNGTGHLLNPPADHVIQPDEVLLLLAEDSRIEHRPYAGPLSPSDFPTLTAGSEKPVEHMLVLGWSPIVYAIIREYDGYIGAGSSITLLNTVPIAERERRLREHVGELETLAMRNLVGEYTSQGLMQVISPDRYSIVLVLGDGETAEQADTRAIITLLLLRDARQRSGASSQRILCEILDPGNRELAATTEINDVVISNELVSRMLAQITYEPNVQAVLEELLRSGGSEIYLKPLAYYCPPDEPVTFEHLVLAAKSRGEVALEHRSG
ncbi:MAG: hypothetical protein JW751_23590 [Polyangiaceae bacterium]|nr:hypothetical protein [Polyangiaceae bacterium]